MKPRPKVAVRGGQQREPGAPAVAPAAAVRTRGPIRELEIGSLSAVAGHRSRWFRLGDLVGELRRQAGNLPLTVIVHQPASPSATAFLDHLRQSRGLDDADDAYWLAASGRADVGGLPAFKGGVVLDLLVEQDHRLYCNLLADIVFFPCFAEWEQHLASDLGGRAHAVVFDQFGANSAAVAEVLEASEIAAEEWPNGPPPRPLVCRWSGGEKLEAVGGERRSRERDTTKRLDLAAVGRDLERKALLLQSEPDRRGQFHTLLDNLLSARRDRSTWAEDLIRQADKHAWPAWAVQSLGALFTPLKTLGGQRRSAFVWAPLIPAVPADARKVLRHLCNGEVLLAHLPAAAAALLAEIQQRFDSYLPATGLATDRAFFGLVAQVLQEVELAVRAKDEAAALLLSATRRRILAVAEVLTMAV